MGVVVLDIKQAYLLNKLEGHFLCFVVKIPAIIKEKVVTVKKKKTNKWILPLQKHFTHMHKDIHTHTHSCGAEDWMSALILLLYKWLRCVQGRWRWGGQERLRRCFMYHSLESGKCSQLLFTYFASQSIFCCLNWQIQNLVDKILLPWLFSTLLQLSPIHPLMFLQLLVTTLV